MKELGQFNIWMFSLLRSIAKYYIAIVHGNNFIMLCCESSLSEVALHVI